MGSDLPHTASQECFAADVMFDSLCQCTVLAVHSVKSTTPFFYYFSFGIYSAVGVGNQ